MKVWGKALIRMAILYALIGGALGGHIAGSQEYQLAPVHAHILVVGWLTIFVIGLFYSVFSQPDWLRLAKFQVVSLMIGGGLMPFGLLAYTLDKNVFSMIFFIGSATILLLAFFLFAMLVFFDKRAMER